MDSTSAVILLLGFSMVAASAAFSWRISRRVREARNWPVAEATILSAEMERVERGRNAPNLPCFAFSYTVKGQKHSGRFALRATGDRGEALIRQMADKKMTIRYDPKMPRGWYIPVDTIGGYEVLQKLSPRPAPPNTKD